MPCVAGGLEPLLTGTSAIGFRNIMICVCMHIYDRLRVRDGDGRVVFFAKKKSYHDYTVANEMVIIPLLSLHSLEARLTNEGRLLHGQETS